jgi:hypothetical protein
VSFGKKKREVLSLNPSAELDITRNELKDVVVAKETKRGVRVTVDPGICGFPCEIHARGEGSGSVRVKIHSECEHIQELAALLDGIITMKELFSPLSRNRIYASTERAGCHLSCPIPAAVIKACEVAMHMALPKDVTIRIEKDG